MSAPSSARVRRLAIIPARGGSKGLPGKNNALIGNRSLLARAVDCAREAGVFDMIMVSTDDAGLAEEGRQAGAAAPFLRPAELAGDTAAVLDAVRHALRELERLKHGRFQTVALLEPTSPLRTPEILRRTIAAAESDGADAAFTVAPAPTRYHPLKQFHIDSAGLARHAVAAGARIVNRQELNPTYIRNGMCYAVRVSALDQGHGVLGSAAKPIVVEGPVVNIDDAEDLALARRIIENGAAGGANA
jgi:CMP-N,N'-diacetyllegionaminic acid synthase